MLQESCLSSLIFFDYALQQNFDMPRFLPCIWDSCSKQLSRVSYLTACPTKSAAILCHSAQTQSVLSLELWKWVLQWQNQPGYSKVKNVAWKWNATNWRESNFHETCIQHSLGTSCLRMPQAVFSGTCNPSYNMTHQYSPAVLQVEP